MFLKRIDIIGFKSFADKTGVEFSPGVTAVVGPNGSGKSNIADAIRWVLGEQSARSLRGTKMEDVIFAGSETRRPINFCEVSLTLDNGDHHLPVVYDEVTITRRVYRSGESEYLINKQSCRLKDIHEMFMDSGMGRESYSIIGQGRIEEMLSTRPEDRRGPFEDAAGIVKFKFRRREAERKLEETAANILRVDDVLSELSRQVGPLAEEAERAQAYKAFDEQLKRLDVSLLVREIEGLKGKWKEIAASVQELSSSRQKASQELIVKQEQLTSIKGEHEAKAEHADALQRELVSGVEKRQRNEGDLALLDERVTNTKASLEDKATQRAQIQVDTSELQTQLNEHLERLSSIKALLETKSADAEAAATKVDPSVRAQLELGIQQLNAELIELHHNAATLRNEVKTAAEALAQDSKKRERLEEDRQRWEREAASLTALADHYVEEQAAEQAELDRLDTQLHAESDEIRSLARLEAECVAEIHKLQSQIASQNSRLELLKDLESGYDGYALGVKTVLQAADKNKLTGVHGSVASVIRVSKQHEAAIETALGGAVQNIIVDTEADARAAIDMLKRRQAGRATFMPISVIKSRRLSAAEEQKLIGQQGYIGVASDLVQTGGSYLGILENMLGNVVVAEKLVDANQLARTLNYRVRIVTLDGDVVSPGGIMSGGSHGRKGPGLLGRSRERDELEKTVVENRRLERELASRQSNLRQQMSGFQERQQETTKQMESVKAGIARIESSRRETLTHQKNAKDRLESILWELGQAEEGQAIWKTRREQASLELGNVEGELARVESDLKARRMHLEQRDRDMEQAQHHLTSIKVEVATLNQEQQAATIQKKDIYERLSRLQRRDEQLSEEMKGLQQNLEKTREEIETSTAALTQLREAVTDLETQLVQLKQERQFTEQLVLQAEKGYREQQQVISKIDEQLHRAEVQAERTDIELNHSLQRLGETYHMTYEWAKEHYPEVADVDATRRQAEALKRQMTALGDVQLSAIEEWSRLSERISFLERERSDLQDARHQLQSVIEEIDGEMAHRFEQVFSQIRAEFQVAFRQLFAGGRADLTLTDPEDLLHSGIDVMAQPPGKKLQNLNLMSGGERALTAMALLFAILRVRPVPFCVLDEVEAALDEANVNRFAQQLRSFGDDTQFIVITHRRGTMEEADALYGVTMQESGVSSLIGVRLSDMDTEFETA